MYLKRFIAALICGLAVSAVGAETIKPDMVAPDYLVGRWSLEGKNSCGAQNAENVEFMANEVFHLDRGQRVDAVGFWRVMGNRVELHLVTSPHRISGAHPEYEGMFDYADLAIYVFDAEKDSFEAVVADGDEVHKRIAYRCQ